VQLIRLWLRVIALGLVAMVVNVAAAFLWVWFYSMAIAPGHDAAFYQAYATRAAPVSSVIAGIPILFLFGMVAARMAMWASPGMALAAGIGTAATYATLDLIMLRGLAGPVPWDIVMLSHVTKLIAAAVGAMVAVRSQRTASTP